MTDTLQDTKPDTYKGEPGDEELMSHYAKKDDIDNAILYGVEVTALCGKKWWPSRDPQRFPVCPDCKEIWESLPHE